MISEPFVGYRRPDAHRLVRSVNFDAISAAPPDKRMSLTVTEVGTGDRKSMIKYIRTPSEHGSPKGFHTHPYDQTFYLISGGLAVEMEGEEAFHMFPGDTVTFPAGVPHRNQNVGSSESVHLSINTPAG